MPVKADGGDGIFLKNSIGNGLHKGSFACILQTDNCYLEFLVEKFIFDPVHELAKPSKHCYLFDLYFIAKEIILW